MDKSLLVFDTETTGLDVWGSTKIFAIGWIFVNPRTGEEEEVMHRFDADSFRLFKKRAEQADAIIAHNLKYDMSLLWKNDYLLDIKKCHDTLNMAALLVDEDESKSELALSLKYLGYRGKDHIRLDDWLIKHRVKNNPNYMNIPWNIIEPYTKVQLEHTGQLFMMWEDVINKEYPKAYAIEQKMPKVLMKMEKLGVLIDTELLEEARGKIKGSMKKPNSEGSLFETEEEYDEAKDTLLDEMVELDVPYNFNPSSNFDVADFLISKGVSLDKTPTGNFKTDVYSLKQVKHPLAALVLEWRRLQKISSTYIDGLLEAADVNGVIHTNYRQNGARTGRLSSNNPNLQNQIGGDNAESEIIKRAFIPRPGYTNISFDYSGMELLAGIGLSGDEVAIKLLKEGHDFHDETLQLLLKYIPTADRTKAKGINFGCVPMDTEILTRRGWKTYDTVKIGDFTLGVCGGKLKWTPITDKVKYENAPVVEVFNSRFSVKCTPNHRWLTRKRHKSKANGEWWTWGIEELWNLNKQYNIVTALPAETNQEAPLSLKECRIIGWLLSDGYIKWSSCESGRTSQSHGKKRGVTASIFQKKEKYLKDIKQLLCDVPHRHYIRKTGVEQFALNPAYYRDLWFRSELYSISISNFVLSLSPEQRAAFLDAVFKAEGHKVPDCTSKIIGQNESAFCEAIKLAIFLEGFSPTFTVEDSPRGTALHHRIRFGKPWTTMQRMEQRELPKQPVWCVKTPLKTWVMRQNGLPMITGNTLYGAGFAKVQQMLNAPDAVVRAFLNGQATKFPQLLSFAKERVMFAERERFVSGVYNRHYRLREEEGGYKCLNYLIQGGCATVMKDAMLRIDEIPHNDLLLQIHDEAVLQVEKGYEKEVIKEVVRCMEEASAEALPLTIPVDVELWSPSWANKTEVAV